MPDEKHEPTQESVSELFGKIFWSLSAFVVAIILKGLVLSVLWDWYMAAIFKLPQISIPQAIGISIIATLLMHQQRSSSRDEERDGDTLRRLQWAIAKPIVILAMGWIVKLFV